MKKNKEENTTQNTPEKNDDKPQIFGIRKKSGIIKDFSRRDFIGLGLAVAAGALASSSLTSCSSDKTKVSEAHDECARRRSTSHVGSVNALAIRPDGTLLVSGSSDNTIKIWSMTDYSLTKTLTGHTGSVNAIAINPAGTILATGGSDNIIKLWSLPGGAFIKDLTGHAGEITCLAISPDGTLLASGSSDNVMKLWSLPGGTLSNSYSGRVSGQMLAFSSDSKYLVSGISDVVKILNISGTTDYDDFSVSEMHTLAYSPDGYILTGAWESVSRYSMSGVSQDFISNIHGYYITSLCVSSDGSLIATGSNDSSVIIWLPDAGFQITHTLAHGNAYISINSLAFNSDGTLLVSGSSDNNIRLWNTSTNEFIEFFTDPECSSEDEYVDCEIIPEAPGPAFNCTCNNVCSCDSVCTCDTVCTCNSEGGGGGGYWYPN